MTVVAFVGLGAMGMPMATQVSRVEAIDLVLFDVNSTRLAMAGDLGRLAKSIEEAVEDADLILTVLPADRHVKDVLGEISLHGKKGATVADFSTVAPATAENLETQLALRGINLVNLALTRGTVAAASGTLSLYMGGGSVAAREALEAVLNAVSERVTDLATSAAAKAAKLANNLVVGALGAAICECMALGEKFGLQPGDLVAAFRAQGCDSWVLDSHIARYAVARNFEVGRFGANYMEKDMNLAVRAGNERGLSMHFSQLASSLYRAVQRQGRGREYYMVVLELLEEYSGGTESVVADTSLAKVQDDLVASLDVLNVLISEEAIRLAGAYGVSRARSAEVLVAGSARTSWLESVCQNEHASRKPASLIAGIDAGAELAKRAGYPSWFIAYASQLLRSA